MICNLSCSFYSNVCNSCINPLNSDLFKKNSYDRYLELADGPVKEVYVESEFMLFRLDSVHPLYAPSFVLFQDWHEEFYFIATNVHMSAELWGGNFSSFRDDNESRLYSLSEYEWALIVQNVSKRKIF